MRLIIAIGFPLLVLLNIFDMYSTSILIPLGVQEWNPFMNYMMSKLGVLPAMIITKGLFVGILAWAVIKTLYNPVTRRELISVTLAVCFLTATYAYFMYTHNYQCLKLL